MRFALCRGPVRLVLALAIAVAALPPRPVAAQRLAPAPTEPRPARGLPASTTSLIRPGVLGGALGIVAGSVLVGIPLAHAMKPTDDGLSTPGIIIGFQLGQAVGIATGVHLGSGRRSDYPRALLVSTALAALGTALLWTDDFDAAFERPRSQVVLVSLPVAQLILTIRDARD